MAKTTAPIAANDTADTITHGAMQYWVAFTDYNRNVIRLEPPLITRRKHIDVFVEKLDDLLSRGIVRIVTDFLRARAKSA